MIEREIVAEYDVYVRRLSNYPIEKKEIKERRSNGEILASCGDAVVVRVEHDGVQFPRFKILVSYKQFKEENKLFEYVEGRGLHIKYGWIQFEAFIERYRDKFEINVEGEKLKIQNRKGVRK